MESKLISPCLIAFFEVIPAKRQDLKMPQNNMSDPLSFQILRFAFKNMLESFFN